MPFTNRTPDFRKVLHEREVSVPAADPKKTRLSDDQVGKTYVTEAYNILNHIHTLSRMLNTIRKPYLNVEARIPPASRISRKFNLNEEKDSWTGVRYLSNEERDQIDLQARVILSRCADRIKEMEALEKRRAELVANKKNPFTRLLPARLRQDEETASSDFIAAHHSSITWYLSRRLTEVSQVQKDMQEERVKRQLERTRTLGSSAGYEALRSQELTAISGNGKSGPNSWLGGTQSNFFGSVGQPASLASSHESAATALSDDDDDDIELTASQIMQFEAENANILKGVQDTLESVQQAESRLMDISALQMELVSHLTRQTELTDQLYEDAIATSSTVEKGNAQLREARRRAKDGRIFIIVFLVGASFSLLFLHYY
ncbi:hypothetical protein AMATHDRAFT_3087 [Amanita thiersii Skay4041]|uniref:t-SNARE coiled-coil homology domain-containing protein n=1 Tax=Amanita thiersii Skay4041 TaxID=703135 RepID=A0A2A9NT06_9AGAR|nr:hypothetical protein AMATHDRAFT_3087 [Amanita thiersii Skay4041]